MGRQARHLSQRGFCHVVFCGINHQQIFEDECDYDYFLKALQSLRAGSSFAWNRYCLMSNNVYLLLKERRLGDIALIRKRLLTKYAMYFNHKYQRSGALIASRYKSVTVEVDEYFIPLLYYIRWNPVKAEIVNKPEEDPFSSYRDYLFGGL